MKECSYEQCTRTAHTKNLCLGHYTQLSRGQDLRPLGKSSGGRNRKYPDGATCKYEGCTNKPNSYWLCNTHKAQQRKYGYMWPVGEGRPKDAMPEGFSNTMTCDTCTETKNWKKFVLGADARETECRDCYRTRLSEASRGGSETQTNTKAMDDLMDFLNRQTGT